MLDWVQHLKKSRTNQTLKLGTSRSRQIQGDHAGLFTRPSIVIVPLIFSLLVACGPKQRIVYKREVPPPEKKEMLKEEIKEEKPAPPEKIEKRETRGVQYGVASWYGADFHGKPTSSGEIYDMYQLTCAHNTLPLGTMVMVTNLENGRSLELKVNDRGPFVKERIIDVSYAAAQMLGIWEKGTALVKVEVIGPLIEQVQRFTLQVGSFTDEPMLRNWLNSCEKILRMSSSQRGDTRPRNITG